MKTTRNLLIIIAVLLALIATLLIIQIISQTTQQAGNIIDVVIPTRPRPTTSAEQPPADLSVQIDAERDITPISPLIYGLSEGSKQLYQSLNTPFSSWGGNPSTRYNWEIGNAWNAGRDWEYRNGNYNNPSGSVADRTIASANASGIEFRLTVPTLGWVAKNDDSGACSFPLPDGGCGDGDGAKCEEPGQIADPTVANVESDPESIMAWMRHLQKEKLKVRFVSMDNEPGLWGYIHYDVHPACTTYDEILQKHIDYATAVRSVMPKVEITGPVTCCWWFYWNSAAGVADKQAHGGQDFLPWFLDQVNKYDEAVGIQTLNVLDIHYFPEGLYNYSVYPETAAQRLRSTRSLWDRDYTDESWINEPIYLIPRMKELIAEHYPGLELGISGWNFGAEKHMNGALAIADVLGIFGREGVYFANYWRAPQHETPGFFAFKMYTNYDDEDGDFGDLSVSAQSDDLDSVSSFASIDSENGDLHIILINKQTSDSLSVQVDLKNFVAAPEALQYLYSELWLERIVNNEIAVNQDGFLIEIPAYSISHIILKAQ